MCKKFEKRFMVNNSDFKISECEVIIDSEDITHFRYLDGTEPTYLCNKHYDFFESEEQAEEFKAHRIHQLKNMALSAKFIIDVLLDVSPEIIPRNTFLPGYILEKLKPNKGVDNTVQYMLAQYIDTGTVNLSGFVFAKERVDYIQWYDNFIKVCLTNGKEIVVSDFNEIEFITYIFGENISEVTHDD